VLAGHSLPNDVPTLQRLLLEQQQMIESLKSQLHRALKHRFGPRSEVLNIDQGCLFADDSVVIELPVQSAPTPPIAIAGKPAAARRRAVRMLKDLPRVIETLELPEAERVCADCGAPMRPFGIECREQLHYVPARLEIIETRRHKYACSGCHAHIMRAPMPVRAPIPKGMAGPSLLAYLIVSKFADGLPLYRIAGRLQRLGIQIPHTLMSQWLMQAAELLEGVGERVFGKVLASAHVFTDDTTLPLQNDDPARHRTYQAKLWVYARSARGQRPLALYRFTRSRSREGPLEHLRGYRGYLQADAFPGYDALYADGTIQEVACNVHARRRFVEAAELLERPGRPHEALGFYKALFRIEREIAPLSDAERLEQRQRRAVPILSAFKAWLDAQANAVLPKSALGEAVGYALRHWEGFVRYTQAGHLEASNNYAERCMRSVAVGRKSFLFVGSERAGHAAALYYSLVESCKLNKINPLTYLTYLLTHARNPGLTLPTPDEFMEVDWGADRMSL